MAEFPSTIPPDSTEIMEYIRFWAGNIGTDVISDADMLCFIDRNIILYPDDNCKITYYSTIDILNWLIRQSDAESGSEGTSGSITRQREKEGNVEYETEYQDPDTTLSGWNKVLSDLLSSPTSIGCDPFSEEDKPLLGTVIIGGATVNGYEDSFKTRQRFGVAIRNNRYRCPNRRLF